MDGHEGLVDAAQPASGSDSGQPVQRPPEQPPPARADELRVPLGHAEGRARAEVQDEPDSDQAEGPELELQGTRVPSSSPSAQMCAEDDDQFTAEDLRQVKLSEPTGALTPPATGAYAWAQSLGLHLYPRTIEYGARPGFDSAESRDEQEELDLRRQMLHEETQNLGPGPRRTRERQLRQVLQRRSDRHARAWRDFLRTVAEDHLEQVAFLAPAPTAPPGGQHTGQRRRQKSRSSSRCCTFSPAADARPAWQRPSASRPSSTA